MSILLLIVGFGALIVGGGLLKIARLTSLYARIPSSTIASAQGLVQIAGVARAAVGARTRDPEGTPCIWYRVVRVYQDGDRGEREIVEGESPVDPAVIDTILLDDGTGRCAIVLGKHANFFERKGWKTEGLTQLEIQRISDGTKLYAVGRVEKLARPERGATHRIEWDRSLKVACSNRSLETMAKDVPWMKNWGVGLLVLGAPTLVYGLWLSFGPLFQ